MNVTKGHLPEIVLLLVTAVWGTSYVVMTSALDLGLNRFYILMMRFFIAAILLIIFYRKKIWKNMDQMCIIRGLILGVIFYVAFVCQITGLDMTTPAHNSMITSGDVVLIPFTIWIFSKIRPAKKNFIAAFVSFIGICFITLDFTEGFSIQTGDLFSIAGAVLFATQLTLLGIMCRESEYSSLILVQFVVAGTLALLTFTFTSGDYSCFTNVKGWYDIIYLGIVCTFLCFTFEAWSLKYVDTTVGSVILATECVFASIISLFVGMDKLSWQLVVGGVLLFGALMIQEIKPKKPKMTQLN